MKSLISKMHLFMLTMLVCMSFTMSVFASDLDSLTNNQNQTQTQTQNQGTASTQEGDTHNEGVSDFLKGYTPVTEQQMETAQNYASPITNLFGNLAGLIIILVSAAIVCVTACDLAYIGLPFMRSILNPGYNAQGGGMQSMGGMGGFGGRMGMGMGGMQGGQAQGQEYGLHRRWVSDEAVLCVQANNPMQQQGGMGGGMMGGGMMGMGSGMMGGQQQQQQPTKSVIMEYLKKRTIFLVIFAVATILLTSSIFTDCGINIAQLLFKVMDKVNKMISGVNI